MYTYVKTYAAVKNMPQTSKALPFAREAHSGQVRKGKDSVPYIYPLLEKAKREYPEYSDQIFLIRYHMMSVVESVKRGL